MFRLFPRRNRKHRNPHQQDTKDDQAFFSRSRNKSADTGNAFFQPKLKVGQRGDKYEQEADAVADAVSRGSRLRRTSGSEATPDVQRITLATPQEDEKLGTAENRMEKDKLIQEKPNLQAQEEEEVLQMQAEEEEESIQMQADEEEAAQMMEEEEAVQAQEEEEESVQMQAEEEETVQMMEEEEAVQAMEEEEESVQMQAEEEEAVQMMEEEEAVQMAPDDTSLEAQLAALKGKGIEISPKVRSELEASMGVDFSQVRIHTGPEAQALCQAMGAQAFTHGRNIFFGKGKYQPDAGEGRKLLAHELTHVVQQGHAPKIASPSANKSSKP
ncbi:MAG: DUF4157 domain-containing protein [Bacteroidota bacterium]